MTRELEDWDPEAVLAGIKAKADANGSDAVERYEAEEQRRESARVEEVLRSWGVPKRIRLSLEKNMTTKAVEWVREWLARGDECWCLVLSADKGVGKSTAAGWWLRDVAKSVQLAPGACKRWWPATEIAALDYYGEDFERICQVGSLVIDDLSTEYSDAKGAFQSKLDRLLDARYREYRRTVITTNLSAPAFRDRYEERIADRLREGAVWASLVGQSMRGK